MRRDLRSKAGAAQHVALNEQDNKIQQGQKYGPTDMGSMVAAPEGWQVRVSEAGVMGASVAHNIH